MCHHCSEGEVCGAGRLLGRGDENGTGSFVAWESLFLSVSGWLRVSDHMGILKSHTEDVSNLRW